MQRKSRIFVAGHRGLVGSAILRNLEKEGYVNIVVMTRDELDLLDQCAVYNFFRSEHIEYVFLAAARVGGIHANATHQPDFLYENLTIATNVIHAATEMGVEKLLFMGSSCIYPKLAPQPIREEYLLTGALEPTNEGYAIAKIAGLKLCEYLNRQQGRKFISAMPTNLYGPGDNFDALNSHVVPGMMRKFHEAKARGAESVTVWGTGTPRREFLHVDDLAAGVMTMMNEYSAPGHLNIGSGHEITIADLAEIMARVTDYPGKILYDEFKPDGTPRKLLDSSRILALGWRPRISLEAGLQSTYQWALDHGVLVQGRSG